MGLELRTVPYTFDLLSITVWSVEDMSGFVYKYCDTKEDAEEHIKKAQDNLGEYYETKLNNTF